MIKFKIIAVVCVLALSGCAKNKLGGKSNIKGKVAHHDRSIAFARIFIKFNAKEAPADTLSYDAKMTADHNGNFLVDKIYHGDYYFYAVGTDPTVASPSIVKGGTPLKVKMLKEVTGFVIQVAE